MLTLTRRPKSPYWIARGTIDGVRIERSTCETSKPEARKKLAEIIKEAPQRAEEVMKVSHYKIRIDGRKGAYGIVVPNLPGCTAMGPTIGEALDNVRAAIRDWIEVTIEAGGVVPVPTPTQARERVPR
jgi:predicted RNase H-like HicB family nuclease